MRITTDQTEAGRPPGCGRRVRGARARGLRRVAAVARSTTQTEANESAAADGGGDCGELNMAVNPWVGYEADAYVVGTVAETELGCTVNYKELKEDVSWQGFGTGEVDVVIEDWGHPDLEKKFFAEQGRRQRDGLRPDTATSASSAGTSRRGWPRSTRTSSTGRTSTSTPTSSRRRESGGKGQFLGADPSYVQFDEAIVEQPRPGLQGGLLRLRGRQITAFQQAEENKEWLIGYFYEPQWLFAEIPLERSRCRRTRRLPGRPGQGRL